MTKGNFATTLYSGSQLSIATLTGDGIRRRGMSVSACAAARGH